VSRVGFASAIGFTLALAACANPGQDPPAFSKASADAALPDGSSLSPAARYVGEIAVRNGEPNFLILDKKNGRIIAFQSGRPTFSGAALTGENQADDLPSDAYGKTFAELKGIQYKITPAGRYTVAVGWDNNYGETLDVNEIQGADWDISIHKVWLGAPLEHRDARLRSSGGGDKHITYGCVDVDGPTMTGLIERIPDEEHTPIYILPNDERLVRVLFEPRGGARTASATRY